MNLVEREGKSVRMVTRQVRQRGGAKLKAVIYTAILAAGIYSAYKVVPIYFANYQLSEKIQEQARFAVVNRYSEDQIRENVYKIAQELEVPAKREDIKVAASNSLVKISLEYTVPVDLGFYHLELHFSPSSENKSLF
jgi:hypothetical protein